MIEVRIRHDFEVMARPLCEWDADDLVRILHAIGAWGIHTECGEYQTSDLVGQIVVEKNDAYFEIIIVTESDT